MNQKDIKVGMSVRVTKRNLDEKYYGKGKMFPWVSGLNKYVGNVFTVTRVNNDAIHLNCDGIFDPDWLDPVDELECLEEGQILENKVGFFIKVFGKVCGSGYLTTYAMSGVVRDITNFDFNECRNVWSVNTLKRLGYKPYHPETEETDEISEEEKNAIKVLKSNGYKITKE